MSLEKAKALVAKLHSDQSLAAEFRTSGSEAKLLEVAKKHGYDVTVEEFKAASKEFRSSKGAKELSDEHLEQVAAGLSIVGVDYAFTAVQTSSK